MHTYYFYMEEQELLHLTLSGYKLGSSFSHKHLQRGGVCIFVHKDLNVKKLIFHISVEKGFGNLCS